MSAQEVLILFGLLLLWIGSRISAKRDAGDADTEMESPTR